MRVLINKLLKNMILWKIKISILIINTTKIDFHFFIHLIEIN